MLMVHVSPMLLVKCVLPVTLFQRPPSMFLFNSGLTATLVLLFPLLLFNTTKLNLTSNFALLAK